MKILARIQPETRDILRIPQGFAALIRIKRNADGTETYTYSMFVDVDIIGVVEDSVSHVEFQLYPEEFFIDTQRQQLTSNNLSTEAFISQIQTLETDAKQQLTALENSRLFTTKLEVLSQMDPALNERLKRTTTRQDKLQLLPFRKVVQQQVVERNNTTGAAQLIASPDSSRSSRLNVLGNLKLASTNFLLRHGDVGKYVETQARAGVAELAFAGTNQVKNQMRSKRVVNQLDTGRVVNEIENNVINALANAPDTHGVVTNYVRSTTKRIRHQFEISSTVLSNTRTIRVQCNVFGKRRGLKNPTIIQSTSSTFSHVDAVSEYNAPRQAPSILTSTATDLGKNVLDILQNDESAVAVNIYRRALDKVNDFNSRLTLQWQFVEQVNLRKGEVVRYIDRVNNEKSVTYRVVSVGSGGSLAANYDARIVPGRSKTTRAAALATTSFYVVQSGDNSRIVLTNTQVDAVAYSFKKRNITIKQSQFVDVGEQNQRLLINAQGTRELIDYDVRPDSTYEYICIIHSKNGTTTNSNINQVYQHKQVDNNTLSLVADQVNLVEDQGETDVTFRLTTSLNPTKLDNIKALLERQGLYELFRQQVSTERDQLSKLLCHHVKRYDNMTGETVSFGIVTDEIFSDRKYGRRYNIQPPQAARQYTYIVTTVLRDTETLFESYDKTLTSPQRITGTTANSSNLTTQEYNAKPAKFRHPLSLRLGTLTSNLSRQQNYGLDELLYGEVGNDVEVSVSTPEEDSSVDNLDIQAADDDTNTVSWSASGNVSGIDYYMLSVVDDVGNIIEHVALHQFDNAGAQTYRHDVRKLKNTPIRYVLTAVSTLQNIQKTLTQIGPKR